MKTFSKCHFVLIKKTFVWNGWETLKLWKFLLQFSILALQYEYKLQNAKKKKVTIEISVEGVRICLKKRKRKMRVVSLAKLEITVARFSRKDDFIFRKNHKTGRETWETLSSCSIQYIGFSTFLMTAVTWRSSATLRATAAQIALNAWCLKATKRWEFNLNWQQ